MIEDSNLLRGSPILVQIAKRGVRVTANQAIRFSAQDASHCSMDENGISDVEARIGRSAPPQYCVELSLIVFDVGIKLLQEDRAGLFFDSIRIYPRQARTGHKRGS
ncbi:hypothetical protein GX48_04935 [Paracoccidioides brasiliensis]|nr:hypothetical protein GX48_04935 [Paracoccidioides brasiliensis]